MNWPGRSSVLALLKIRSLVVLLGVLSLYCCRHEPTRQTFQSLHTVQDVQRVYRQLIWPPWQLVRTYVSVEDDVHLYFEYTRVILGEIPDSAYIASWQATNDPRFISELHHALTRKSGLRLPYRDVPIILPPVALMAMLVPRAVTDTLSGYRIGFAVLMAMLHLGSLYCAWRLLRRLRPHAAHARDRDAAPADAPDALRSLLHRAALATACLGPLLVGRYDPLPTFFVMLSLWLLVAGWGFSAALLLLLGAGSKLFPLFLVPIWAAVLLGRGSAERRRLLLFLAPFVLLGLLALVGLIAQGKTPDVLLGAIVLFGKRPIQIESLVGSILRCAGSGLVFSYGSDNVRLTQHVWLPQAVDALNLVLSLALAGVAWQSSRRLPAGDDTALGRCLAHFALAGLLLLLVSSKLLSPQYLVWVLPLAVLLPGCPLVDTQPLRRMFRRYCGALGLTQVYFPFLFALVAQGVWPLLALVLLRNLLLLWALVTLLHPAAWQSPRAPAAP